MDSPRPTTPDRVPGNWAAARYGRTGLALLAIAGGFALAGWTWPQEEPARASSRPALALLGMAGLLSACAIIFLVSAFVGPRWFPRRTPHRVFCVSLLLLFGGAFVALALFEGSTHPTYPLLTCQNNLRQIAGLLFTEREAGKLRVVKGAAFLTQLAPLVVDEDLKIFFCPKDPGAPEANTRDRIHCSYRGPDLETARRFVEGTLPKDAILACDACGDDGTVLHHKSGLVVLFASGKVQGLRRGTPDGAPAKVGPGSEDPRFVHLVR